MSTSETRAVLVGIVVVALVGLAALARWYRNRRLNARDDEREVLLLRPADLDSTSVDLAYAGGLQSGLVAGAQTVLADPAGLDQPREDQLDEAWPDTLAAMNVELHSGTPVAHHLAADLEQYHEPCQEWCCWERRLEADRAAWLELVRADVTVVAEWIVAGTPGRWVPSAAGWPSDDWRGEMIPA